MVKEAITSRMKQFGFTESESKVYIGLLRNSPATGYELAARAGVPRSAIYNIIKKLEAAGVINAVQERPARYVPIPPKRLMDLLEGRTKSSLDALRKSLEKISTAGPENTTYTVQGYGAMLDQARSLINGAQRSLFLSLWRREAQTLDVELRGAQARGVQTVAFSFTPLSQTLGQVFCYLIPEEDLEKHWEHRIVLIADHARAILGSASLGDENRAVITEEKAIIEVAVSNLVLDVTLFGQRHKIDTGETLTLLTETFAPIDELLARAKQH